ncbi:MAG: hypothetical protein ACJ8J0_10470, partial [Longimicrobiaceae bacterium]
MIRYDPAMAEPETQFTVTEVVHDGDIAEAEVARLNALAAGRGYRTSSTAPASTRRGPRPAPRARAARIPAQRHRRSDPCVVRLTHELGIMSRSSDSAWREFTHLVAAFEAFQRAFAHSNEPGVHVYAALLDQGLAPDRAALEAG